MPQVWKVPGGLKCIPCNAGVRCVQVTKPTSRIGKLLVMRAIELLIAFQRGAANFDTRAFSEFAEVVKKCGKGNA